MYIAADNDIISCVLFVEYKSVTAGPDFGTVNQQQTMSGKRNKNQILLFKLPGLSKDRDLMTETNTRTKTTGLRPRLRHRSRDSFKT